MIKNAFAIPARSAISQVLQRQANSAHRPKPAHQIRIYTAADAIRRQQISKTRI